MELLVEKMSKTGDYMGIKKMAKTGGKTEVKKVKRVK